MINDDNDLSDIDCDYGNNKVVMKVTSNDDTMTNNNNITNDNNDDNHNNKNDDWIEGKEKTKYNILLSFNSTSSYLLTFLIQSHLKIFLPHCIQ